MIFLEESALKLGGGGLGAGVWGKKKDKKDINKRSPRRSLRICFAGYFVPLLANQEKIPVWRPMLPTI